MKRIPALEGKSVLMLFYEASTRTHSSFEVAAKRLSAEVTNFDVAHSSISKGESVRETIETLQAMRTDYIVVRHSHPGLPGMIARQTTASVINAGDGAHEHPTQALLDAFTIKEKFPDPRGKKVLIIGDILHSRVARSTSTLLQKLGIEVAYLGPGSLVPKYGPATIRRFTDYEAAMAWAPDVVYLLRVQMERQDVQFFPSVREYHRVYGITNDPAGRNQRPGPLHHAPRPRKPGGGALRRRDGLRAQPDYQPGRKRHFGAHGRARLAQAGRGLPEAGIVRRAAPNARSPVADALSGG